MKGNANPIQWPTDPDECEALARAFDEGEYWYERARDAYAVLMAALYEAEKAGDKDRVALLEHESDLAFNTMKRLRAAAIRVA